MEEDIKVLENCWVMTTKHVLDEGNIALKLAIKNIIKGYKQLEEKENNKFKKIIEYEKTLEKLQKETIWKSKVKEKIEEIKLSLKDDCLALHEFQRLAKIDVLEELLREE